MASKKQRIFFWFSAACFAAVVALFVALPWLYAWAVPHFMVKAGVKIDSSDHHPLKHLRLHGIRYQDPHSGIDLQARFVELPAFYPFILGALFGEQRRTAIEVADWQLLVHQTQDAPASDAKAADAALSPAAQVLQIRDLLHLPAPWLQTISLHRGSVEYDGYHADLKLVRWQDGVLSAGGGVLSARGDVLSAGGDVLSAGGGVLSAGGDIQGQSVPFTLSLSRLSLPSPGLQASVELTAHGINGELKALVPYLDSGTLTAQLSLQWKGGLAEAGIRWNGDNWVPDSADFQANDFPVPSAFVAIPNYAQPLISTHITWQEQAGTLRLNGHAESLDSDKPPLDWSLQARIDTAGIEVNALQMSGPWISGELSEPILLRWERLFLPTQASRATADTVSTTHTDSAPPQDADSAQAQSSRATDSAADTTTTAIPAEPMLRLVLDVDLADFPLIPLEGRASGMLGISTDAKGRAQADLSLESSDLSWQKIRLESLRLQASLRGSVVRLIELDIRAADGSYFTGTGSTDLSARTVERAQFKGNITDQFVLALGSALPQGENAQFVVELRGQWADIAHAGQVRLNQIRLGAGGDHFDATLQWEGRMLDIPDIKLSAYGDNLEAEIRAAFLRDQAARTDRVTLEEAHLKAGRYPAVTLEVPSVFTYDEADATFELTPLKLTSDGEGYVHAFITLPEGQEPGIISLQAAQVSGRWFEIYRGAQLPCPVGIDAVTVDLRWRGTEWLRGNLSLKAHAEPGQLPPLQVSAQTVLDQSGVHIKEIKVSEEAVDLLNLTADLPLAIFINARNRPELRILGKEPLYAQGELNLSDPEFSAWLEETFTLQLGDLYANLQLGGTASAPTGEATLLLESFAWQTPPAELPPLPRIDSLHIKGGLTPEEIRLHSLEALFGTVPLNAQGLLPFDNKQRRALIQEGKLPDFAKASLNLTTGELPLRNFGATLPPMLRPLWLLSIEAAIKPGFDISGVFTLTGASTRPLPPIGSIDNINARIQLAERILSISHLDAQVGAQPVAIGGSVNIEDLQRITYDLALNGGELPIVRSPGLILRASPDMTLKTDEEGITTLAGNLELGSSFYTIDFTALAAPGGGGGSAANADNRPPFFAITEQPLADWQLNLRLRGNDFLRIRTPAFEGIASANFNLRGPLSAPYAFGSAEIDQGVVMFPYSTLRVQNGGLILRQDDPYVGRLNMTASGRAYGYDLRMILTGTINDPNIQFDASPSLDQGEILMLLSTGQVPNAPERSAMSRLSGLGMFLGNSVLINLGLVDPLDDRFELLIGEDITEKDQDTISVRYRLTDDWSVIGNYDRFDAYNLDLQWTIYRD